MLECTVLYTVSIYLLSNSGYHFVQYHFVHTILSVMMMIMVLCPKAGSLDFTPPGNEMSAVVSHCLPHRQLWVSNLPKAATQWLEVDSNPRSFCCKAQNILLHHRVPPVCICNFVLAILSVPICPLSFCPVTLKDL